MKLHTEYIELRVPEPGDVDSILLWENDTNLWHVSDTLVPLSRHLMEQFVNSNHDLFAHRQLRFVIHSKADGKPVGLVDLFEYEPIHQRVSIGILIDADYRNRHYAEQSIQLVERYCFETLLLHQLVCSVGKSNESSIALFEKCGFQRSGDLRDWKKTKSGWEDVYVFQKIKK